MCNVKKVFVSIPGEFMWDWCCAQGQWTAFLRVLRFSPLNCHCHQYHLLVSFIYHWGVFIIIIISVIHCKWVLPGGSDTTIHKKKHQIAPARTHTQNNIQHTKLQTQSTCTSQIKNTKLHYFNLTKNLRRRVSFNNNLAWAQMDWNNTIMIEDSSVSLNKATISRKKS